MNLEGTIEEIKTELSRAMEKFPRRQSSAHEGYAVLLEEVDELWSDIKSNKIENARVEAVQVAAMAIRLILEGLRC